MNYAQGFLVSMFYLMMEEYDVVKQETKLYRIDADDDDLMLQIEHNPSVRHLDLIDRWV